MRIACLSPRWLFALMGLLFSVSLAAQSASDIYLFDIARMGNRINYLNPVRVTDQAGYDNQPHFTPDGRYLLYASIRDGVQSDIYAYHLRKGKTENITRSPESEFSPQIMPGTHYLTVVRVEADSSQRLWRLPFRKRGNVRVLVPEIRDIGYYAWIDRYQLALYRVREPSILEVVDLPNDDHTRLVTSIGRCLQPLPGEYAFTYADTRREPYVIQKVGMQTRANTPLVSLPEGTQDYAWTRDGYLLAGQGSRLFWLDPRQHTEWQFVGDLGLGTISRLAVSADGKRLAVVAEK